MSEYYKQSLDLFLDMGGPKYPARFLQGLRNRAPSSPLLFVGDRILVRLWLCRVPDAFSDPIRLLRNAGSIVLCAKPRRGDPAAPILALAQNFTLVDSSSAQDGSEEHYECILDLSAGPQWTGLSTASVDIELQAPGGEQWDSFGAEFGVAQEVYISGDIPPPPADPQYPPPADLVTQQQVDQLIDQKLAAGAAGITSVEHDSTLTGDGTSANPLSVVGGGEGSVGLTAVAHDGTLTGDGTSASPLSAVPTGIDAVSHDSTLTGDGTPASPLSAVPTGLETVAHDSTLTGDGTTANPLSVVGGGEGSGGLTAVAHDDTLTGDGTSANPLSAVPTGIDAVSHDSTLTGDGTSSSPLSVVSSGGGGGTAGPQLIAYPDPALPDDWNSTPIAVDATSGYARVTWLAVEEPTSRIRLLITMQNGDIFALTLQNTPLQKMAMGRAVLYLWLVGPNSSSSDPHSYTSHMAQLAAIVDESEAPINVSTIFPGDGLEDYWSPPFNESLQPPFSRTYGIGLISNWDTTNTSLPAPISAYIRIRFDGLNYQADRFLFDVEIFSGLKPAA